MRSLRTLRSGAISPLLVTISLIGMLLVGTGTAGAQRRPRRRLPLLGLLHRHRR